MTKQISKSGHAWFDTKGELWTIADKDPDLGNLYRPDINIAQAWELQDVLWEQGCDFHLSREGEELWWVEIHNLKWHNEETNSYKILMSGMMPGTAPEAICRAFLKAKAAQ